MSYKQRMSAVTLKQPRQESLFALRMRNHMHGCHEVYSPLKEVTASVAVGVPSSAAAPSAAALPRVGSTNSFEPASSMKNRNSSCAEGRVGRGQSW